MLICPSDIFSSTVMLLGKVFILKQPINLGVEKISQNKSVVQTPITYFIKKKEKHVSIRYSRILTLVKSGAPFFRSDIMYMIYLDVKYFSVVCLCVYYEKPAVKTKHTTMGHFFAKKLNYCLFDIIYNSVELKCHCLKHT